MPFCPKCRYEYNIGVITCPDCDEQLVDQLPVDIEDDSLYDSDKYADWVQLARLTSYEYANMIVEVLHAKEIPAVILSGAGHFGQLGQLGPSSSRPVGGAYSIMVPREFVIDADREAESIMGDDWKKYRMVNIDFE